MVLSANLEKQMLPRCLNVAKKSRELPLSSHGSDWYLPLPNFSGLTFGNADNFFSFPGGAMHAKVWGYHHHVIFKTPKTRVWVKERCSEENGAASSFMRIGFFVLKETDIF